jgi:hypothetical protein
MRAEGVSKALFSDSERLDFKTLNEISNQLLPESLPDEK